MACSYTSLFIFSLKNHAMKMRKIEKIFMNTHHHKEDIIHRAHSLLENIELQENQRFLEVGCGTGAVSLYCAQNYPLQVVGVDLDPDQIQNAQSNAKGIDMQFLEADAAHLPFSDASFDIILSFGVMHHIPRWVDALQEIVRVLNSQGHFIYWDLMFSPLLAKIGKRISQNYGMTTLKEFNAFIRQSGLIEIHTSLIQSRIFSQYEAIFVKK